MKKLSLAWPVGGQISSAGLSAVATALIYYAFSPSAASAFFGLAASESIMSTLGAFGQQRVFARDVAKARLRHASLETLVLTRLRFTALVAAGAAVLCGIFQYLASGISPTLFLILVLWTFVDGIRGVMADAHFGLHLERRAVLVGDATRWILNLGGILGYVLLAPRPNLTGLALIALLSVSTTAILAGYSLFRITGASPGAVRGLPVNLPRRDRRSGTITMISTVAAALTSQASIVAATIVLPAGHAATFAFGMRIAAGLTLVQNGLVKVVLPRAVALADPHASDSARVESRHFIMTTTRLAVGATVGLLLMAIVGFAVVDGNRTLVLTIVILGVASVFNVAAGPVGAVLVAVHREMPVLLSNVFFGIISLLSPLLYTIGVPYVAFVAVLAAAIALHNGVLALVTRRELSVRVGLWSLPAPAVTQRPRGKHRLQREV